MNQELQALFTPLLREIFAVRNPRTGQPIRLPKEGNAYLCFKGHNGGLYCYTPHPDQDGWYYSFVYAGRGKGSRTGTPKRWTIKKLMPHRKRKAAQARARKLESNSHKILRKVSA